MKLKYLDRIIEYLQGEMSESDQIRFEKELETNEELKKEFEIVRSVDNDIKTMIDLEDILSDPDFPEAEKLADNVLSTNDQVREIFEDSRSVLKGSMPRQQKPDRQARKFYLIITSIAAILIAAMFIIASIISRTKPEQLFTKYYKPMTLPAYILRSDTKKEGNTLNVALSYYIKNEFQKADSAMQVLSPESRKNSDILFFKGVIKLGIFELDSAINALNVYIGSRGNYYAEAMWYLGLSYLKSGNTEKAEEIFGSEILLKSIYRMDAVKILKRLNQINSNKNNTSRSH